MYFFLQFVLIPALAASCAAIAATPLGAIIAWRRLVYFGEALAHSAWLGIALALIFSLPIYVGIWITTAILIFLLFVLQNHSSADSNNILGTLGHAMLAIGVIVLSQMENIRRDLFTYLFGDMLNTQVHDLLLIALACVLSLLVLYFIWHKLILLTICENIARAEIPKIKYYEALFLILLGVFTGIMMQFLGLMLVMAFFIIPVQTAARIAQTPEQCVLRAIYIALICVLLGIILAFVADFPVAPAIVAIMAVPYLGIYAWQVWQGIDKK